MKFDLCSGLAINPNSKLHALGAGKDKRSKRIPYVQLINDRLCLRLRCGCRSRM